MAKKPLPSPELLRKLLRYEPETGRLFWRERTPEFFCDSKQPKEGRCRRWNKRFAKTLAMGSINTHGYRSGSIFAIRHLSHRVIWAMQTGRWPANEIDHINGDKADNRWSNLREATRSQNAMNMRSRKGSSS